MGKIFNFLIFVLLFILIIQIFSINVYAGQAGVGVINVPPKYGNIRIVHQDTYLRLYLIISDYNSWGDIYQVTVSLEDYGAETYRFLFKQFDNAESYNEINQFSQPLGTKQLLSKERCSSSHSSSLANVDERCDLELLFVFKTSHFSRINLWIEDRGGLKAEAHIDYIAEEITRDSDILLIPGPDGTIVIALPSYFLNLIALIAAFIGTVYFARKTNIKKLKRESYEKG